MHIPTNSCTILVIGIGIGIGIIKDGIIYRIKNPQVTTRGINIAPSLCYWLIHKPPDTTDIHETENTPGEILTPIEIVKSLPCPSYRSMYPPPSLDRKMDSHVIPVID